MSENSKISVALRWVPPIFNSLYKLAMLAALVWIGIGLQDVASALYQGAEGCVVEPDASNSSNGSDESNQPGVIRPLMRGTL